MTTVNYQLNQRAYYNGQEVTLKSYDKTTGKCVIVIDGETKIVDWNDIFGINNKKEEIAQNNTSRLNKISEQMQKAQEKARYWGAVFDFNLGGVRQNRSERLSFQRQFGKDIKNMDSQQQEQYKQILNQGYEYSSEKNYALGMQLSYSHQVASIATQKQNLLNEISIFNATLG